MGYKYTNEQETECRDTVTGSNHSRANWTWKVVAEWLDDHADNEIEPYKTQDELAQDAAAKIVFNKRKLKEAVENYIRYWIDDGMKDEFTLSRARFESGQATMADLPKAAEVALWKLEVFGDENEPAAETGNYYAQKNYVLAGNIPSFDFTQFDPLGWDFHDLKEEREAFLASL